MTARPTPATGAGAPSDASMSGSRSRGASPARSGTSARRPPPTTSEPTSGAIPSAAEPSASPSAAAAPPEKQYGPFPPLDQPSLGPTRPFIWWVESRIEPEHYPVKTRTGWQAVNRAAIDELLGRFEHAMWCYSIGVFSRTLKNIDAIADALRDCGVVVDVGPDPNWPPKGGAAAPDAVR